MSERMQRRDELSNEVNLLTQSLEGSRLSSKCFEDEQNSAEKDLKRLADKCSRAKEKLRSVNEVRVASGTDFFRSMNIITELLKTPLVIKI